MIYTPVGLVDGRLGIAQIDRSTDPVRHRSAGGVFMGEMIRVGTCGAVERALDLYELIRGQDG